MAAHTAPIYSRTPDIQWNSYLTAANTTVDLTSGTIYQLFEADATEGGFVEKIKFKSVPGGNTTATVCRIWLNNGSSTGTAANNVLLDEITLPLITATGIAAIGIFELALNIPLPPGYRIYATLHTASANGWAATVIGGKY